MRIPIEILFSYPFPEVFPHHQLKEAKREGKTVNDRWIADSDPFPNYLKYTNTRFRGLIGIDMARCTGCRRCERVCPNKIIRMVPRTHEEIKSRYPDIEPNLMNKKGVHPEIYFGRCLFCGYCGEELVGGCPYDALHLTNLYDISEVFDDNLIFTPEKLQQVVEKVGRGTQNWWTTEPAKPKPKKPRPPKKVVQPKPEEAAPTT
jgi:formate hydrogenlyase subunit 6/NADH:ubiquinone oxidoreductase subunit I